MSDTPKPENSAVPPAETGPAPEQDASAAAGAEAPDFALTAAQARVAELEGQIADLTGRLLLAHADMDNLRKRTEKEKGDTAKYAISKFAGDMIGVADNFQRALGAVPAEAAQQDGALKSLLEGVAMIERAFGQALERHNVKKVDPTGEAFNPHLHQAVMEMQNPDVAAGTILQVYEVGYTIEDRLLRPASVVVAKGGFKPVRSPEPSGTPQAANDAEAGAASDTSDGGTAA